jgi:hypothetical protein
MQTTLNTLKAVALVAMILAAAFVCLLLFQADRTLKHVDSALSGTVSRLNGAIDPIPGVVLSVGGEVKSSLDTLNRQVATVGPVVTKAGPVLENLNLDTAKLGNSIDLVTGRVTALCPPKASDELHPCGTIADVGKTLNTVRGAVGQIEIAAIHENRNLTTLDTQETTLFNDFHGTATRANTSLDTFNLLLANPNLALTMKNAGEMTTTANAVEKKLAQCTLHPTLPCVLKSDILFGAQVGGYLLK